MITLKKWQSPYQNNHLRLMRVHIGLMVFSIVGICFFITIQCLGIFNFSHFNVIMVCAIFDTLFCALLAYGVCYKYELARQFSKILFIAMLFIFPIATWLAIFYFLPKTVWKQPES